jgi:hypothetical protein
MNDQLKRNKAIALRDQQWRKANAARAMLAALQDLDLAAQHIVDAWENGDLAQAVRELNEARSAGAAAIVSAMAAGIGEK